MFNRKERFLLLRWVVKGDSGLTLGNTFRHELGQLINAPVPHDAFFATDYHLDWLYAALRWAEGSWVPDQPLVASQVPVGALSADQEDIDLILCWPDELGHQMVLFEAKAYTGWSNKQVQSKVKRLRSIFGEEGSAFHGVKPTFVLTSFQTPEKVKADGWPPWAVVDGKVLHAALPMPSRDRYQVERCTAVGKKDKMGGHWRIRKS